MVNNQLMMANDQLDHVLTYQAWFIANQCWLKINNQPIVAYNILQPMVDNYPSKNGQ